MVLPLERVTAAEIYLLRYIHGQDAVVRIAQIGTRNISDMEELSRLRNKYRLAVSTDEKKTPLVDILWPGISPVLPHEVVRPQKSAPTRRTRLNDDSQKREYKDDMLDRPVPLDSNEFVGDEYLEEEPPEFTGNEDDPLDDDDEKKPADVLA